MTGEREGEVAVVVGAGPGLGLALVRRFAQAGMRVAAAARDGDRLAALVRQAGIEGALVAACDAAEAADVAGLFARVEAELGPPALAVYNAGAYAPGGILDIDPAEFERCWRVGCLGGFHVGQQAARRMAARGRGTILFTGATASLRGSAGFANLAVPKFGLRALAQSMARELGPRGVHVAHIVLDGQIDTARSRARPGGGDRDPLTMLQPEAIAETYLQLHRQDHTAWTFELDLRPAVEKF